MIKKSVALGLGAVTALSFIAVNVAVQSASAAPTTIVSTPTNTNGWFTEDGAPAYVADPAAIDGLGELQYGTSTSSSKVNYFHATGASGVPLSGVNGLSYSVRNSSGGPEAAYDMEVFTTGTAGYTTLVWEPYQNGFPLVASGAWNTYSNLENGRWWSTHFFGTGAGSQSSPQPLSFFQTAYPNANVVTYGVGQGSGNPGSVSFVDDVSFEGTTTNFEPSVNSDCRARGYSGIGPRPIVIAEANGAEVPCANDSASVATVSASVLPVLTSVRASVLNAATSYGTVGGVPTAAASSSVASVTLVVGGITVRVTGLQSNAVATLPACGAGHVAGSSSVAKVVVNGKTYNVGSKPFSIKLGALGAIQFNNQEVVGNRVVQRALLLGYSDHRYNFSFGEAIAGLSC
jgi:hypothetical protein